MSMTASAAPAVFLDRDGTLIEDLGYPRDPERVRLLRGVEEGLQRLRCEGFLLVVVGNQSGIGRGIVSEAEARAVHARFAALLKQRGIALDAVKYCPHAPWEGCACRKPSPCMLLEAAAELGIDLGASYMVGDKLSDVLAGRRAGCHTILLGSGGASVEAVDHAAPDWTDVLAFILGEVGVK